MAEIIFNDFSAKVKNALDSAILIALEESAGELESQVKRNTAVDTGQLKSSWQHNVTPGKAKSEAVIGSPLENAIWEEFGTGEYALNGDGRKGGWAYEDPKTGETIWTHGKRPRRAFWNAYTTMKDKLINHIREVIKGGVS